MILIKYIYNVSGLQFKFRGENKMQTAYERIEEFDDHFGVSQLMTILRKSESTVRRLIKKNTICFYYTSGIYYFKKEEIKTFLEREAL